MTGPGSALSATRSEEEDEDEDDVCRAVTATVLFTNIACKGMLRCCYGHVMLWGGIYGWVQVWMRLVLCCGVGCNAVLCCTVLCHRCTYSG